MKESPGIKDALLRFYERRTAADVSAFDSLVAAQGVTFLGSAPGEFFEDRDVMKQAFGFEGVGFKPGSPRAWEEGAAGFSYDEPVMLLPDGSGVQVRTTFVWRREQDAWKVVHAHFSVGVPDEEVVELQKRWGSGVAS